MRASPVLKRPILLVGLSLGWLLLGLPKQISAQSLTSGSLRGTVQSASGEPLSGVVLTVEGRGGTLVRDLETDLRGGFRLPLLVPGTYSVLAEQVGYQPLRLSGIIVVAGSATSVTISLELRPPPITTITEQTSAGGRAGGSSGPVISGQSLESFDRPRDATGLGRDISTLLGPGDGRSGLAIGANGLPSSMSRLFADGVLETLLRHPALRGEPVASSIFQRDGLNQAQFLAVAPDAEWRGTPGAVSALQTRGGGRRFSLAPYGTYSSAKLGGNSLDNFSDSSAASFQVGAVLSAAIVPDTAHVMVRIDYQSIALPAASPWMVDSARFKGATVSLRETLPAIGTDSFHTALAPYTASVVRRWKGGSGSARLDWQVGRTSSLAARLGFASWTEDSPQLGADLFGGAGTHLKGRDISGAAAITTQGASMANELRVGFNAARRDWTQTAFAGTELSSDAMTLGSSPLFPGSFDTKSVDLSDALQFTKGAHQIKAGASVNLLNYQQDFRFGSLGLFRFGDLDRFAAGNGTFFQTVGPAESAKFNVTEPGVFLQDTWDMGPDFQFLLGVRYETQIFPKNRIAADTSWRNASGIANDSVPKDNRGVSPRVGFVWNVRNRGEWVVRGSGGLYHGDLDPSLFAEATLFDGGVTVRRGQGTFKSWPAVPSAVLAPTAGKRLTLFSGKYRAPRTAKFDFAVSRAFAGGTSVSILGSYGHTDYLLRRVDLNRADATSRRTQDGRVVYGTLVQQGGLVSPSPTSNRRFSEFDLVSAFVPTGYADHYEVTALLSHQVARGLSVEASYTYAKTTDNLVGSLEADPVEQLNPLPEGLSGGGDWSKGRSDLDVPHRAAARAEYRSAGKTPVVVGARWRWRSGLPFTPGFRPGVDVNGDGGSNDPASLDQGIAAALTAAGCSATAAGAFAERNSCREAGVQALDLRLAIGLPVRVTGGGAVYFTIDGFNVVSSAAGVVDRAALLIDPSRSVSIGAGGVVTVPYVSNSHFGSLLSRRVEPRLVRFGLRMEY
jgi:hypothetical protein